MTVASLVRSTLALRRHRVVRVRDIGGKIVVELDVIKGRHQPCAACGLFGGVRDRLKERRWRHVPVWGIACELRYRPARIDCEGCGKRKVEAIPWSAGKSPIAQPLIIVLATWSRLLAWDVVAKLFGVSWSTVVGAVESAVAYGEARRDLSGVSLIGVDELSRRKGHVYHTNVYDLSTGRLLWSGEGRAEATLEAFFDWFGPENTAKLVGVCCDMWAPYVDVITLRAGHATLVFDRFHIMANLLRALDEVRRAEQREIKHANPGLLKGLRYALLKNPGKLTAWEQQRLAELEANFTLKTLRAWALKEMLRHLWTYKRKAYARRFLDLWFHRATHSKLQPIRKFAWMLRRHYDGILAWFDLPISNGLAEAMNNNAKAISHRARGYRSAKAFRLSMLHCLGGLQLPETVHRFG